MSKGIFIESAAIGFRPLEKEDLAQLRNWRNNFEVRESFREYRPLNMQNQEKWFDSLQDGRDVMFGIVHMDFEKFIGVCGLCYIDQHNRHAEVSYYIGEESYRGTYDAAIIKMIVKYGFEELGLHRISAECYAFATDRLVVEECGFKREGVMRDVVFRHGRFWDSIMLSILDGER